MGFPQRDETCPPRSTGRNRYWQVFPKWQPWLLSHERRNALLRALHGKKVKGRKVVVRSVGKAHTQACDVLWLGSQYPRRVKPRAGMLTIGAGDAFLDAGGMISIEFDASRIVLNVNRTAIKAGDLDISSQVLRIAESVR